MTQTASLTATYAGPHVPDNPWWVRLEQIPVTTDVATVGETAALLDALYQVDPCTDVETSEEAAALTTEDVAAAASETLTLAACDIAADGSCEVQIKVIRSHQTEPYRLHVAGGSVVETVLVNEEISQNIAVSGATETTLDYPVIGAFTSSWQADLATASGSRPAVKRNGNVLYWADSATGTLSAAYLTTYNLVTIKVNGVDGELGEALIRVVFHALAEEMTPELPDPAEMDRSLCGGSATLITEKDRVTCYKAITVKQVCSCSKDEVASYSYDQIVDCPDWVTKCPGGVPDCMALLGSETVKEYVECAGDNQVSGTSRIWNVSSGDYYRKVCCDKPPDTLPQCYEKTTSYRGGKDIVNGRQFWRDLYGPLTQFRPVSPPGGICGKHITRQVVAQSNCCDGVEPLAWDASVSPAVMQPNNVAIIGVTGGGRYPYQWRVVGAGFQFGNGSKKITTSALAPAVRLSALPLACGMAEITVTDGCTTTTGLIRCTAGQWVMITDNAVPPVIAKAIIGDKAIEAEVGESSRLGLIGYIGRYKVEQQWSYVGNGTSTSCGTWCSTCVDSAFVPGSGVCVWSLDKSLLEVRGDAGYGPLRGNTSKQGNGSCTGDYVVMSKVDAPCGAGGDCYANPPYHNAYIAHGPRPWDGRYTNTTVWEWQC